ncbi:MAG TPA: flagellar hook-associated protein FlgK [Clostridiaceae bacterium]|nr:flagellar hook-associated protein FlgK [Clostridiaceae bacterium]
MSISFFGMDMAISGLSANQKALEVTGHNVANLGTPGFSRQSAVMVSAATRRYGNWYVEMGTDIQQIRQIRHTFSDNIYRSENNNLGYWESRSKAIVDLQSILGEPIQKGFQVALNNFWDSFQELSKSPESLTVRALVKQRADSLANYLNQVGSQINKLQTDLNTEIKARIDEVNAITEKIAALNVKIMSAEAAGNLPNDYYDQRNELCDRLSKLVSVETWETRDGSMDILVGGYLLVSKGEQTKLVAAPNDDLSHFFTPMLQTRAGDIPINVGQGIIKGLLEARGEVSGAKNSYENGLPNTTSDITIAVDISSTGADNLAKIKANIATFVEDIKNRGLDYNFRLVTFGGSEAVTNTYFGKDTAAFLDAVSLLTTDAGTGNNFEDVIDAIESNNYPADVNKYLLVFTDESIDGDGTVADNDTVTSYINRLNKAGITVSVATDPVYHDEGDTGESGWNKIAEKTGGKTYDIENATDLKEFMVKLSADINSDVNMKMTTISEDLNIISTVRKQLNALINIMAREVNYLHLSGKTLRGEDGGLFFEPMEPTFPISLGNIKVSDALKDLNNIAASTTDANGDNQIALAIAGLRNKNLITGNKKVLSLDTYYQNIILEIGNKGYEAANLTESYQHLVNQADANRQSVMGVSLDEEMTNMIKYKFAYNANARFIDVVNQMLETIMYRMGVQ